MNKTKPFLCLIVICAIVLNCSTKKDPTPSTPTPAPAPEPTPAPSAPVVCYLATDTYVDVSWNSVITYTYSDNRITSLSSDNGAGHIEAKSFTYDAQGRVVSVAESYTDPSSGSSTDNTQLTYDANNRVIQEVSSTSKRVNTYNSSGQKVKEEYYTGTNPTFTLDYYNVFTYPSTTTNNYSTLKQYDGSNNLTSTSDVVYDTNKNPYTVLFPGAQVSENNVTQVTFTYPGNNTPSVVTYTYTYNSNGYPLTSVEKNSGYTFTDTYTYNCK